MNRWTGLRKKLVDLYCELNGIESKSVPSVQEYRQARLIVKRYHATVKTNHWRNVAEQIVDRFGIKQKNAAETIEGMLKNEV